MKKDKEYAATHSMDTAWFAVDADGYVAMMRCDDAGPAPAFITPNMDTYEDLIEQVFGFYEGNSFELTDEQIDVLMRNAVSGQQYYEMYKNDTYCLIRIRTAIVEVDKDSLKTFRETMSMVDKPHVKCLAEDKYLYAIALEKPYAHSESEQARISGIEDAYIKLFRDGTIKRIVTCEIDHLEDSTDEYIAKVDRHNMSPDDFPFYMYGHDYQNFSLFEKENNPTIPLKVSLTDRDRLKDIAVLPIRFSETDAFQLAQYIACDFDCPHERVSIDGIEHAVVKFADGKTYCVRVGEFAEPIELEDAFDNHDVSLHLKKGEFEYIINGKRGYTKYVCHLKTYYFRLGGDGHIDNDEIREIEIYQKN